MLNTNHSNSLSLQDGILPSLFLMATGSGCCHQSWCLQRTWNTCWN